jgi:hypothetical protein
MLTITNKCKTHDMKYTIDEIGVKYTTQHDNGDAIEGFPIKERMPSPVESRE